MKLKTGTDNRMTPALTQPSPPGEGFALACWRGVRLSLPPIHRLGGFEARKPVLLLLGEKAGMRAGDTLTLRPTKMAVAAVCDRRDAENPENPAVIDRRYTETVSLFI